jgi:toxin ParE1/3/4
VTSVRLTPLARADLDGIWDYTVSNWGVGQAERYVRVIDAVCRDLAAGRVAGRRADVVRPGLLRCAAGSHVVFYRLSEGGIDVIRILHRRMDVERHL